MKDETTLLVFGAFILVLGFSMAFFGRLMSLGVFFGVGFFLIIASPAPTIASILMKSGVQQDSPKSFVGLGLVIVGCVVLLVAFLAFYFEELVL